MAFHVSISGFRVGVALAGVLAGLFAIGPAAAQPLTITHLAGTVGGWSDLDGPPQGARLSAPFGLCTDGRGHLYATDGGAIRRIALATGEVTTLAGSVRGWGTVDGTGEAVRFWGPRGLAVEAGNLYVADYENHTIRKVVLATGAVTTFAGSPRSPGTSDGVGSQARFNFPSDLVAEDGSLYVADEANYAIRKIDIATGAVTTFAGVAGVPGLGDGTGSGARFPQVRAIASDGAGSLYVAEERRIRKIALSSAVVTTIHTAYEHEFDNPRGLAADTAGNLYVADSGHYAVKRMNLASGQVMTLAGLPYEYGYADGVGYAALFRFPWGIASDGMGSVFVADEGNSSIRKILIATREVTTFAGEGIRSGSTDGVGSAARFDNPRGVAADGEGNLFVADTWNHTIRRVDLASGAVTTFAGSPGTRGNVDGVGGAARFHDPAGLAADGEGRLFVADAGNAAIRVVEVSTGQVRTLAGAAAMFQTPVGIALDGAGNAFVADMDTKTIRRVEIATGRVWTIAGATGIEGSEDGIGSAARFHLPWGITADRAGNLFVTEAGYNTHIIRKIVIATAEVTTLAGEAGAYGGSADGIGTAARFYFPLGIAADAAGDLYVADAGNRAIRKIVAATREVTTVAGTSQITGSADVHFNDPTGLAIGSSGQLYITESYGCTVRKSLPTLSDLATIDAGTAPVGQQRQLDTAPHTATSWLWEQVRIPSPSLAKLSSTSIPNPVFTPDVAGSYVFRLTATDGTATSITTVSLQAWLPPTAAVSGGGTVCPGGSATIQALLGGVSPWTVVWSDGVTQSDLTISPATRTVAPGSSTVYSVTSISDGNATGTASGSASVVVGTPAGPAITAPAGVPAGSTGNAASVAARAGATWAWSATGGEITSGQGTHAIAFTAGESGFVELSVVERDASGCESSPATIQVPIAEPAGFHPVALCRLFDTRESIGPTAAAPALAPGEVRPLLAVGLCDIPANAKSLAVNVTAVSPEAAGSITLFAADAAPPAAPGTVSFVPGRTRASNAVVRLPADGSGTLEARNDSAAGVDVLVDVSGYFR